MSNLRLIMGTRGSRLALAQTNAIAEQVRRCLPSVDVEIRVVKTMGDLDRKTPFVGFANTGLFVKEIERLLLDEAIDLAVHSMKDVPTEMDDRLILGATPAREDARDAAISREGRRLAELPPDAVVGTSSPRRRAQVLRMIPDVRVEELRGNVDTRLRKLDEGRYDCIILAMAGLKRLGLAERVTEAFDIEAMIPAPGQGALAIQSRKGDARLNQVMDALNVPAVEAAVRAERAFLARLGGGCQLPIGAHAERKADRLALRGCVSDPDGKRFFQGRIAGSPSDPEALGAKLARQLLDRGASSVLQ